MMLIMLLVIIVNIYCIALHVISNVIFKTILRKRYIRPVVPSLFGTRDWFRGRQFFHRVAGWGGWGRGMVQAVMGSNREWQMKLCSLTRCSPLLLCGLVPNRPRTGTSLWPGGLGTPALENWGIWDLERLDNVPRAILEVLEPEL